MVYTEVHIKGKLSPGWSEWFEEMQIDYTDAGETVLSGNLPDQAAIYGMLSRLSSLGIPLISVNCSQIGE
jgi:hypothetical protein